MPISPQEDKFASIGKFKIAYQEFGDPNNEAIILIPGMATQLTAWPIVLCTKLAKLGYRVIRFDQRDTGLSDKLHNLTTPNPLTYIWKAQMMLPRRPPYTLLDMTDDLIGLMDVLQVESAHLVGSSMGGMIAQLAASVHAERTLSLTSIMSTSGVANLPGPTPRMMLHLLKPRPRDTKGIIERGSKTLKLASGGGKYVQTRSERLQRISESYHRSHYPAGATRHMIAIAASGSRARELRKIKAPSLVIHGSKDPMIPPAAAYSTARLIPNASLAIIEEMGHDITPALVPTILDLMIPHFSRGNAERDHDSVSGSIRKQVLAY